MKSKSTNRRVLIIDDTREIHDSLRKVLSPAVASTDLDDLEADLFEDEVSAEIPDTSVTFDIDSAFQGQEGLDRVREALKEERPYAMAFVDMRMPPGWDGLETIKAIWAEDTAIQIVICTAYSDRSWSEIQNSISRKDQLLILKKPFDPIEVTQLAHALTSKWEVARSERELLEQTVMGAVGVMTEVLSLVAPAAFRRSSAISSCVQHLSRQLGLESGWAYKLAGLLGQVGCITVPAEVLERVAAGQTLVESEKVMLEQHPQVGAQLLERIPRLRTVASIVRNQGQPIDSEMVASELTDDEVVATGTGLLTLAQCYDREIASGNTHDEAVLACKDSAQFPAEWIKALSSHAATTTSGVVRAVMVCDIRAGMVLGENVCATNGAVICPVGTMITPAIAQRLENFASGAGIVEPFRVHVPQTRAAA